MENILEQRPVKALKGWTLAGIIAIIILIGMSIFWLVNINVTNGISIPATDFINYLNALNIFFSVALLVFFIGIMRKKNNLRIFVKAMLWVMLMLNFYFVANRLSYFGVFETGDFLLICYYLGMFVAQLLLTLALVGLIVQYDGKKRITGILAFIAFVAAIAFAGLQTVYILKSTVGYSFGEIFSSFAIVVTNVIVGCFAGYILAAAKQSDEPEALCGCECDCCSCGEEEVFEEAVPEEEAFEQERDEISSPDAE